MENEFKLSEKSWIIGKEHHRFSHKGEVYAQEDVKEFIKKVLKDLNKNHDKKCGVCYAIHIIKKYAGKKLVENGNKNNRK